MGKGRQRQTRGRGGESNPGRSIPILSYVITRRFRSRDDHVPFQRVFPINSPAAKGQFFGYLVSPDKVFFIDVYNKIQVGVELLPLGNLRNSRW